MKININNGRDATKLAFPFEARLLEDSLESGLVTVNKQKNIYIKYNIRESQKCSLE